MFTIRLTAQQLQALVGLLDAGVRGVGLRGVKEAAELITILENSKEEKEENEKETGVVS